MVHAMADESIVDFGIYSWLCIRVWYDNFTQIMKDYCSNFNTLFFHTFTTSSYDKLMSNIKGTILCPDTDKYSKKKKTLYIYHGFL